MVPLLRRACAWVGLAGLALLLYLYSMSGLVAPRWAVAGLLGLWGVLLVLALWLFSRRPLVVLLLPFLGLVVWFGVLVLGDLVLGWTA